MPFIELLAPPQDDETRQRVTTVVTDELCVAFKIVPQAMTLYFIDVAATHYAHAVGKWRSGSS